MRTKKSFINAIVNIVTYILMLIPTFVVRRVFLQSLGENWLGINSLYTNIVGLLSIVELGIGSAIIFSLYKPFAENDKVKIKGYLNYYSKFYNVIGIIIFILGIIFIPFLDLLIKDQVNTYRANINFILYLLNTVITYLFSYKLCILNVSQEGYKISIGTALSRIIMCMLQIIFLWVYPSFEIYLIIQIIIQLLYYILINKYIDKKYPWINKVKGHISSVEIKNLSKNIKALFLHKIGGFILLNTDNLIITKFINLAVVAKFTSYNMIINAGNTLVINGLSGITASIGNLIATGNNEDAYIVHKKIFFVDFWITSFFSITMYNTLNQFIFLWLGKNQLLDDLTLIILLINFYFNCMRGTVERFQDASGTFYYDRYVPIIESIINVICSIILVKLIGLSGVFLGTLISNISVIFWTKPFIVYKYVFKKKLINYFKMYFKYISISVIPLIVTHIVCRNLQLSINSFILNCIINVVTINGIYILIFYKSEEFKYFKRIALRIIKNSKS